MTNTPEHGPLLPFLSLLATHLDHLVYTEAGATVIESEGGQWVTVDFEDTRALNALMDQLTDPEVIGDDTGAAGLRAVLDWAEVRTPSGLRGVLQAAALVGAARGVDAVNELAAEEGPLSFSPDAVRRVLGAVALRSLMTRLYEERERS